MRANAVIGAVVAAGLVLAGAAAPAWAAPASAPPPTQGAARTAKAAPYGVARITMTGLPAAATVKVTVTGPRYARTVTLKGRGKALRLTALKPGTYTVTVADAVAGTTRYYPATYVKKFTVARKGVTRRTATLSWRKLALTYTGLGKLRLGMSVAQARAADPSLRVDPSNYGCTYASSRNATTVVFNPDGRLSYITPRSFVRTASGLTIGSTYARVKSVHKVTKTTQSTLYYDPTLLQPRNLAAYARYDIAGKGKAPRLELLFTLGAKVADGTYSVVSSKVTQMDLDGGQQCFG